MVVPFFQLRNSVRKGWNASVVSKLKPIYKVVPMFILWQIWKKRNCIKHGGKRSYFSKMTDITRNLVYLAGMLFPWLKNIPDSCVDLVRFLSNYRARLKSIVVK